MCLTEFSKTTKKGPWKVAKICRKMFPYLKCSSMKPWGKGSRKSSIEDLDIFKTNVLQIEATGNFKNLKGMQKISAVNTIVYYNLQLFQNYIELNNC